MRRSPRVALIAVALAGCVAGAAGLSGRDAVPGVLPLSSHDVRFGGLSGVHVLAGGGAAWLLTDRGVLFAADIARGADGFPVALTLTGAWRLKGRNGRALSEWRMDSEGIAVLPDGTLLVGFEGREGGRIHAYADPGGVPEVLAVPPAFAAFPANGGIEALAAAADGTLYAVPEQAPGDAFPIWRMQGGDWAVAGHLPRAGGFRPVAADVGPDGSLYVLERRFTRPASFASRIRRAPPGDLARWETVLETADGVHGNLEGLSVWRDGAGALRATLVTDDNFRLLQRNDLVEYVLPR